MCRNMPRNRRFKHARLEASASPRVIEQMEHPAGGKVSLRKTGHLPPEGTYMQHQASHHAE